jgi:transposase-like protein
MEAACPQPQGPRGLVHPVRQRLPYGPWTARKAVAADGRALSAAAPRPEAAPALERVAARGETQSPPRSPRGRGDGDRLTVRWADPPERRRVLDTTQAMESWNDPRRTRRKTRGGFPHDASSVHVLSLALHNVAKQWPRPMRDWQAALHQCVSMFGERVPV